jgi:hypothetical protein
VVSYYDYDIGDGVCTIYMDMAEMMVTCQPTELGASMLYDMTLND